MGTVHRLAEIEAGGKGSLRHIPGCIRRMAKSILLTFCSIEVERSVLVSWPFPLVDPGLTSKRTDTTIYDRSTRCWVDLA